MELDEIAGVGVTVQAVHQMVRRGDAERVAWGLHRIIVFPVTAFDQIKEATLWFRPAGAV